LLLCVDAEDFANNQPKGVLKESTKSKDHPISELILAKAVCCCPSAG